MWLKFGVLCNFYDGFRILTHLLNSSKGVYLIRHLKLEELSSELVTDCLTLDKNPDKTEECTKRFLLIQQGYEVLSDPQERSWYDKHRDSILRGGKSMFHLYHASYKAVSPK